MKSSSPVVLESLHLLVTYSCNRHCAHCFVNAGPQIKEYMSASLAERLMVEALAVGISAVYIEGGEPLMKTDAVTEIIKIAHGLGVETVLVTNGDFLMGTPSIIGQLVDSGLSGLEVSTSKFHTLAADLQKTKKAMALSQAGDTLKVRFLSQEACDIQALPGWEEQVSILKYRGRAAFLPVPRVIPAKHFDKCPWESLEHPERVHIGPDGEVQICQGISIGNVLDRHLADILWQHYRNPHVLVRSIVNGGPVAMARRWAPKLLESCFADACQLCFFTRMHINHSHIYTETCAPDLIYDFSEENLSCE